MHSMGMGAGGGGGEGEILHPKIYPSIDPSHVPKDLTSVNFTEIEAI